MMKPVLPQPRQSRLGEVAVWAVAAVLTLSVHAGAAYYLMQEEPKPVEDGGPQAAIMIELAAIPQAAVTDDTTSSADAEDTAEVKSENLKPVEEVVPEEQPQPEPVVETPPPEPVEPEPPQEVAEPVATPVPEEMPEPVPDIDPIENQMMAALENVEVPLPEMRPVPPVEEKKVEKKDVKEKKRVERKPRPSPQASQARETAKAETTQSDRTAASRNSVGSASSSASSADWNAKVRSVIQRRLARSAGKSGMKVLVSFRVSDSGSIGSVGILQSTGDAGVDQKIASSIQKASVSAPPSGANTAFKLLIDIR